VFTGLVENTGRIKNLSRKVDTYRLEVLTEQKLNSVKIGDSISVNGTCLSVVVTSGKTLSFDIMAETFKKTSFAGLKNNDIVNLERSLELNSRLDGHFVTGHVDSVQEIKEIKKHKKPYIDIAIAKNDKMHVVKKGSVAIDGVSLTIGEIYDGKIRVYIIPHTLQNTNLRFKKKGDAVNLEFDVLGKYVLNAVRHKKYTPSPVTEEFLKNKGFI